MMGLLSARLHRLLALGLAVLVIAVGSSCATAVTLATFTADPLRLSMADTSELNDVVIESRSYNRSGGSIVGVTTALNNTQLTDVSVDVIVRLERLDGSVVERQSTTVLLGAVSVTTVELSLSQPRSPAEFAAVNVTAKPTL